MLNVSHIIRNLDTPTILFFLGILSAVGSLQSAGQLDMLAVWMDETFGSVYSINLMIGFLSSIVDNVPLVAGSMGMYEIFPATPPHDGFALIVCDNMHNVGNHYKVLNRMMGAAFRVRGKSANCVTFLWPPKSSKTS